jgi:DNA repair protein RadC
MRKPPRYKPLEIVLAPDESAEVFGDLQVNPPRKPREDRPSKAYKGLRVTVALVRDSSYRVKEAVSIGSPADAYTLLRHLGSDPQENFIVLVLDDTSRVTGICEVHRGTLQTVQVHPADVLRPVLVAGAARFIVAHNHPSGRPEPSADDLALTKRLAEAAKLLGLQLLDHIIVGHNDYVALSERGVL